MNQITVIRQGASWLMAPLVIVTLALTILLIPVFGLIIGAVLTILAVLMYISLATQLVAGDLFRGFKLVRAQHYDQALAMFERCYDYFSRHPWIDDYRYILLLNPSVMTFREMSLFNMACCHFYLNDGIRMYQAYQRLLEEYPDNAIAQSMLRMVEICRQIPAEVLAEQKNATTDAIVV